LKRAGKFPQKAREVLNWFVAEAQLVIRTSLSAALDKFKIKTLITESIVIRAWRYLKETVGEGRGVPGIHQKLMNA